MENVIIVPDLHIGKGTSIGKDPIGVGLNSRVEDQITNLNWVLNSAKNNEAKHIFLLGDIWDEVNPKSILVKIFFNWVKQVNDSNIKLHIIMGNHDFIRTGRDRVSMLNSLDELKLHGVNVISDFSSVNIGDTQFVCMPFTDRKQLEAATIDEALAILKTKFDSIQYTNKTVLLGHMALEGSLWVGDEVDQMSNEIFIPLDTLKRFSSVFMGHIHNYQKFSKKPFICHVGSLDKTSFGEKEKCAVIYDLESEEVSFTVLPCRQLIDITVNVPNDCKNATQFLLDKIIQDSENGPSSYEGAITRIKIKLNSYDTNGVDKEVIVNKLNELKVFHLASFVEIREVDKVIVKNADIDEHIDAEKAVDIFGDTIDVDNDFRGQFKDLCRSIIQSVKAKGVK